MDEKDTKARGSLQGRSKDIKRKQRGDGSIYRNSIKRELKRLKRFVKKKLDDYDYAKSLPKLRALSNSREQSGNKGPTVSQEDVQSKLKEYKDRVSRLRNLMASSDAELRKSIGDLVTDVISLMLRIQNTLETMRKEIDRGNKTESFTTVKETLKSLYELLIHANLNESIDSREMDRGLDRAKRESSGGIPFVLEPKGFDPRIGRWKDGGSRKKQPSFLELDSGEDTSFYRFDSQNSFPVKNGDSSSNTDYANDEFEDLEEQVSTMERVDDAWDDYYEPPEFFKNSRNDRMGIKVPELWEVERTYEGGRDDRWNGEGGKKLEMVKIESDGTIRDTKSKLLEKFPFPKNHRPIYASNIQPDESVIRSFFSGRAPFGNTVYKKVSNHDPSSIFKGWNPWIGADHPENKRSKRGKTDLRVILDQEMIKEDDANSKDCNCRVIRRSRSCDCRSKRGAIESLESVDVDALAPPTKQRLVVGLDKDIVRANLQEDTDVEVFADLEGGRIEKSTQDSSKIAGDIGKPSSRSIESKNVRDTRHDSNIPALESRSEVASFANLDPRILNAKGDEDRSTERSVRRDANKSLSEEDGTTINVEGYIENSTENFTEGSWEETESSTKGESWSAALVETTTASSEEQTVNEKGSENSYDKVGDASSKARGSKQLERPGKKVAEVDKVGSSPTGSRKSKKRAPRLNVARQSELSKKVRTLQALRDLFRKLRESRVLLPIPISRSRSIEKGAAEYRRNRAQQVRQLRDKLRDKRQMMLSKYERGVDEVVDKEENAEKRKVRRREAWERIRESEDFRDMIDREKLAYMLMYRPSKYDAKRQADEEEMLDDVEVPVTEILRSKDTWRRIFNPKNEKNFRDPVNGSYDNLEVIRSEDLRLTEKREESEEEEGERKDKVYFALVEDVERPRIFYYEENPGEEGKRVMRVTNYFILSIKRFFRSFFLFYLINLLDAGIVSTLAQPAHVQSSPAKVSRKY